jgi:predicted RNA-binding protein with TRAM domain
MADYTIDLDKLVNKYKKEQDEAIQADEREVSNIVINTDKDPRVSSFKQWDAPKIEFIEIKKSLTNSPYCSINWSMPQNDVKAGNIKSFKIYRRVWGDDEVKASPKYREKLNTAFSRRVIEIIGEENISNRKTPRLVSNFSLNQDFLNEPQVMDDPIDYMDELKKRQFQEIAEISISKFLKQEARRLVFRQDSQILNMRFEDRTVKYGDVYEYLITSINDEGEDSARSERIVVKIDDRRPIPPPKLTVKQIDTITTKLIIKPESGFNIDKIILFTRGRQQLTYSYKGAYELNSDTLEKKITSTPGHPLSFRVFAIDAFGEISIPAEHTLTPISKYVAPQSRFNTLQNPILKTEQAEGSSNVLVKIYPNDPKIIAYNLDRKDLTINERKYTLPDKEYSNYGGTGWEGGGIFYVEHKNIERKKTNTGNEEISRTDFIKLGKEITFIDDTTNIGHAYSYRLRGRDLFNNPTGSAFSLITIEGAAALAKVESVRYEVIRKNPLLIKLSWNHLMKSGIKFIVQRRREDQSNYVAFPETESNFIFDEVVNINFLQFITDKRPDDYVPNLNNQTTSIPITTIKRDQNMPDFLEPNSIYYYRIIAKTQLEGISNPIDEFPVYTYPDLARPIDLNVSIDDVRVRPLFAIVSWNIESLETSFKPDKFIIQRRVDTQNARFVKVGESYLNTTFFDYNIEFGVNYVYRVVSRDALKREKTSNTFRVSVR